MSNRLFILLIISVSCFSQNQTKKWYFGNKAALDFTNNPPTALVNSNMVATEGSASMADANGNLLFYTNGVDVWNQSHLTMANGNSIGGYVSASQSALIVPKPLSTSIYYIFTNCSAPNFISYSILDMSMAAGMGSVTVKNATLTTNALTSEKLAGVKHCNGVDFWILSHDVLSQNYYAFALTATGLNTVAVVSSVGQDTIKNDGYMKISPNGKKIALIGKRNTCQVQDFDNTNGSVGSASLVIAGTNTNNTSTSYGIEFSPDGTKLYLSDCDMNAFSPYNLYQWDLCAGSAQAILASRVLLYSEAAFSFFTNFGGALQLGPNGKIYRARNYKDTLGVINNPNSAGFACNYVHNGQPISPKLNYYGLPNFVSSYFNQVTIPTPFVYTANCNNILFSAFGSPTCSAVNSPVLSSNWSFGDPASGTNNVSPILNPSHYYQAGGTYTVQLILNYACKADTLRRVVTIPGTLPSFSLSGKPSICKNQTTTLSAVGTASSGPLTYSWLPGNSSNTLITVSPTATTVYTVTAKDANGCMVTNTIQLTVNPCTGIEAQKYAGAISIYPNPNDGRFYVDGLPNVDYSIYNQLGVMLKKGRTESSKEKIDLGDLPDGIYFIELGAAGKVLKLLKTSL